MKYQPLFIALLSVVTSAQAAIVCETKMRDGETLKVTVSPKEQVATVQRIDSDGVIQLQSQFKTLASVWDGHMTGLMTAPGISFKYENWYGCIRAVEVTTNFRTVELPLIKSIDFAGCKGGTTPDEICFPAR